MSEPSTSDATAAGDDLDNQQHDLSRHDDNCDQQRQQTANMMLNVITLNCWWVLTGFTISFVCWLRANCVLIVVVVIRGLKFISSHREQRIKSIAKHIAENNYDLVFLQEVSVGLRRPSQLPIAIY